MKKTLILSILFLFVSLMNAQVLLEETMNYPVGDSLNGHGWTIHSGSVNNILVSSETLTYPGYVLSGVGKTATVTGGTGSRIDINKTFTEVTIGSVYAAALIKVTAAVATGDYLFHLGPNPIGTNFRGRLFIIADGTENFKLGLIKGTGTPTYTTSYPLNTTCLVILEYKIVEGAANDTVKLYVNPNLNAPVPVITAADATTDINPGSIALRQGGNAHSMLIGGIRVSTLISDVTPVELTSFVANVIDGKVNLTWSTATETNNSGFAVERSSNGVEFTQVGFVKGNGTTTERNSYSFVDNGLNAGKYTYRLKQTDFDGTYEYTKSVEVSVGLPTEFSLSQNYPNPFNPSTTINFALPKVSNVKLTIYNALGKEVATLVNGTMEAGNHSTVWNASNNASGMYFFKLEAGNFTSTKKMMLIK